MKIQCSCRCHFIIITWLLGIFCSCKSNSPLKEGISQRDISCYDNVLLKLVDTFGYYGCLIPPADLPFLKGKAHSAGNDHDHFLSTNLIGNGIDPVIIVKDSLANFAIMSSSKYKGPLTTDHSFNHLMDKLYTDTTLFPLCFPIDQLDKAGEYTIRTYSDMTNNPVKQDEKIAGGLLLSRIVFEKDSACFYYPGTEKDGEDRKMNDLAGNSGN